MKNLLVLMIMMLLTGCHGLEFSQLKVFTQGSPPIAANECRVVHVTDGYTFTCVRADRQPILVQLADIYGLTVDAPLGGEAKTALSGLVLGQSIRLEEARIDQHDPYKRTLATVYNAMAVNVNQSMLSQGYARVDERQPVNPQSRSLQHLAQEQQVGVWAQTQSKWVNGWQKQGMARPAAVVMPPFKRGTLNPTSLKSPQSQPKPKDKGSGAGFRCGVKKTCGQMNSCAEARFYLQQCGLRRLDRDGDGIPCESLCGG